MKRQVHEFRKKLNINIMSKANKFKMIALAVVTAFVSVNCDDNNNDSPAASANFSGTYVQQDQMARPAINTVFIASGTPKDNFNATVPSMMGASYTSVFKARLLALNSAYTTNALTQTADQLSGLLATDVLNVKTSGTTTFFDGTNVLTGRALADDVIDVELLLIFGGPTGASNPGLTKDNVGANDAPFLSAFPYLAAAW
ncbi:DUF4331 family protein [Flavobacterium hiemivividum]|uniref:DUF4331 domain-containing protein n=1 Tax=Flavobacterium hiemivividum TaxID=2541734 RepID=A0A4R5CSB0_9FLAO|nr:DUF4331 family protein [Flavobacterium hiemivividum]TDE01761.1 DUF4331 domain-containing protein [Flavobacterium hiemivividum]